MVSTGTVGVPGTPVVVRVTKTVVLVGTPVVEGVLVAMVTKAVTTSVGVAEVTTRVTGEIVGVVVRSHSVHWTLGRK